MCRARQFASIANWADQDWHGDLVDRQLRAAGDQQQTYSATARGRLNAKNGINGRKIELQIVDDGSDPNQSIFQFNTAIGDGAVAVLAPPQSTADLALKPIANDKKIPTLALDAGDREAPGTAQAIAPL